MVEAVLAIDITAEMVTIAVVVPVFLAGYSTVAAAIVAVEVIQAVAATRAAAVTAVAAIPVAVATVTNRFWSDLGLLNCLFVPGQTGAF